MISTIRNLLYILCRNNQNSKEIITNNMNDSVIEAFSGSIYFISGTTSFITLRTFANKILTEITNEYKPDLALFAYTLYGLLKEKISITPLPTPKEYLNKVVPAELIKAILSKISNHDIKVEINNNPPKLTRTWPEEHLIISDTNVKKKITIAFGQCGSGAHAEIINIETLQTD